MQITGGAGLSGALFDGFAHINDSVSNLVTGIGGTVFAFMEGTDHVKGEINFNKTTSIS